MQMKPSLAMVVLALAGMASGWYGHSYYVRDRIIDVDSAESIGKETAENFRKGLAEGWASAFEVTPEQKEAEEVRERAAKADEAAEREVQKRILAQVESLPVREVRLIHKSGVAATLRYRTFTYLGKLHLYSDVESTGVKFVKGDYSVYVFLRHAIISGGLEVDMDEERDLWGDREGIEFPTKKWPAVVRKGDNRKKISVHELPDRETESVVYRFSISKGIFGDGSDTEFRVAVGDYPKIE